MNIQRLLETQIKKGFLSLYDTQISSVEFQETRKDFEGDITVVIFSLLRYKKGNPETIGTDLGNYLVENVSEISHFNVVKGFLNLVIKDAFFLRFFNSIYDDNSYGFTSPTAQEKAIMVEYSSPNTNKPLHLGHIRNNLLGYSVAAIIEASGKKVYRTQIVNDRGIHICKSMLAWQKFGNGETPENTGLKGDKLVGNYYVRFDIEYKKQIESQVNKGISKEIAQKTAPILLEAQKMLKKWEDGDEQILSLWKKMNQWVYDGFDKTYKNLGVTFDKLYYESDTYLLGRDIISDGLKKGVFFKKEDGSIWCDLTQDGLDEKLVLRADGTAVYITQDIGTAIQRSKDFPTVGGMIYTVGNEQDYHFKVLFLILKKLGYNWANQLYHLSYGMVDLPSGKMKSREGTVVDADDLMIEMTNTARSISKELGKLEGYSNQEKEELYKIIGLGALKYFILKVEPRKRILFDPEESVDFHGNTGAFIQYTYARIQSILRKVNFDFDSKINDIILHQKEKELIKQLKNYTETVQKSAKNYSPAIIANYTYDLVKTFNSFYQNVSILSEKNNNTKILRVQIVRKVGDTIKSAFSLLGIEVPERM